jgi:hypothetical protein
MLPTVPLIKHAASIASKPLKQKPLEVQNNKIVVLFWPIP